MAGVLAAASNNSLGIAGTTLARRTAAAAGARQVRRLRLRHHRRDALGSRPCGARHPDQCQPGAGHQPQPRWQRQVCSAAYRDTIAELANHGVLVVAAAGNETGPVETPGNCAGVLTVAGLRHLGTKVGYSSLGAEVAIAAPAGNCVGATLPCQFPIVTLSNSGTTSPAANTYTDGYDYNVGTSFSAPLAAGTAALMLSLNPALRQPRSSPACSRARGLRGRRRAAHLPDNVLGRAVQLHHRHLRRRHAGRALGARSLAPVARIEALDALTTGTIRLDGSSAATAGRVIAGWQWTLVSLARGRSPGSTTSPTTTLQAPDAGSYLLRLVATDNLGASDSTEVTLSVSKSGGGGGGGGSLDWPTLFGSFLLGALAYRRRSHQATSAQARPPSQP